MTSIAEVHAVARVLRSEHNHFTQIWDEAPRPQRLLMLALTEEPTDSIYSTDYHEKHELPATPTLQTALKGLITKDITGRDPHGYYTLIEPFLAEWLTRDQRDYDISELTRRPPSARKR